MSCPQFLAPRIEGWESGFEQVVSRGLAPTRLDHGLAWLILVREGGGEGFRRVVVDAALLRLPALPVEHAGYRISFVVADSSVVHGTAQDTTRRLSARCLPLASTHEI